MTTPTPTQYYEGLTKSKTNMDRLDLFINGDAATDVPTDNGPIPSLAKALQDATIETFPGLSAALSRNIGQSSLAGTSVGTVTISGASSFSATAVLNTFVPEGTQINLRLVTSSTAAAGARHFMQVQMI